MMKSNQYITSAKQNKYTNKITIFSQKNRQSAVFLLDFFLSLLYDVVVAKQSGRSLPFGGEESPDFIKKDSG